MDASRGVLLAGAVTDAAVTYISPHLATNPPSPVSTPAALPFQTPCYTGSDRLHLSRPTGRVPDQDTGVMSVSRLEASCDLVTAEEFQTQLAGTSLPPEAVAEALDQFRRGLSFRVEEFAVLTSGTHLTLHDDRGFTSQWSDVTPDTDPWQRLTAAHLEANVRATVLPDTDIDACTGEAHPWTALASLLTAAGVPITAEQLRDLPYDIELSTRVRARLQQRNSAAHSPTNDPCDA